MKSKEKNQLWIVTVNVLLPNFNINYESDIMKLKELDVFVVTHHTFIYYCWINDQRQIIALNLIKCLKNGLFLHADGAAEQKHVRMCRFTLWITLVVSN